MIEIQTWIFICMIAGLIIAGFILAYQDQTIKKLKKKLKH
jgi:hypothetical protein